MVMYLRKPKRSDPHSSLQYYNFDSFAPSCPLYSRLKQLENRAARVLTSPRQRSVLP